MKKILLTNRYDEEPFKIIQSVIPEGFQLEMLDKVCQEEVAEKAVDADYLLVSGRLKIDRQILENARKLKMIQRTGVGLDSLDLEEMKKRNIPLYVNKGVNADSVAEHSVLLMLACLRRLVMIHQNTKNGVWKKQSQGVQTRELKGKKVCLIGMGNIGQAVAEMLKGFGTETLYYSRKRLPQQKEDELKISYVELEELLHEADIISLHCPLTEETRGMLNQESIEKMKDGVMIINTARGALIEEEALVQALKSGKVQFAGLDVFAEEPLKNTELSNLDNVIMTPHIGGITYDSFHCMMQEAMRNIELYEKGKLDEIEQAKWDC